MWEETDEDNDSSDGAFNQIGDLNSAEKNVSDQQEAVNSADVDDSNRLSSFMLHQSDVKL